MYQGVPASAYGNIPPDPQASLTRLFRPGDAHKLKIHAKNQIELLFRRFPSLFDTIPTLHLMAVTPRGVDKHNTFCAYDIRNGRHNLTFARFRIMQAVQYVQTRLLVDMAIPEIENDVTVSIYIVSMYKFFHVLEMNDWSPTMKLIAEQLIANHLLAKESVR